MKISSRQALHQRHSGREKELNTNAWTEYEDNFTAEIILIGSLVTDPREETPPSFEWEGRNIDS